MTNAVHPSFDETYDRIILGKRFVEFEDYYKSARPRYARTFEVVAGLGLPAGSRHLDIGGGQMALLGQALCGFVPFVGDVVETAATDVMAEGATFQRINLMDDVIESDHRFDLITLLEVIEHLPIPPYVVLEKLRTLLRPGGWLVMTTPNGFRIRNIVYMLANREVLGIYRYPDGDEPLGHQHEYTLRQMEWQLKRAGFQIEVLRHYRSGTKGHSLKARIGHALTLPIKLLPHLSDGLMIAAQRPEG
ncbi:MAG: class I SAM-dependent methyltransferase [Alkalilacustris sp.]